MFDYLQQQKEKMTRYLEHYIASRAEPPLEDSIDGKVPATLLDFTRRGKMIRGSLVDLGYRLFSGSPSTATVAAGTSLELFQSALLIHDDIMDRDHQRRGGPALYFDYYHRAQAEAISDAYHLGEALGICAGDIAFFLGYEILAELEAPAHIRQGILRLCSREMVRVGSAQMQDVYWGSRRGAVSRRAILDLYRYKTGRYTFSLPLMLGALLAEAGQGQREGLSRIGELLGIIFQIRDDELGLFGDEKTLGKPIGSDIREGKKTLYIQLLYEKIDSAEAETLSRVLGNPEANPEDVEWVLALLGRYKISGEVDDIIREHSRRLDEAMKELASCRPEALKLLRAMVDYNLNRQA